MSDYEIGAVAATLPPGEACDFLVELANLRGGPDNITVLIVRSERGLASRTESRCQSQARAAAVALASLDVGGRHCTRDSGVVLMVSESRGGPQVFVLATAAIGVGLFGMGLHSHAREKDAGRPSEVAAASL